MSLAWLGPVGGPHPPSSPSITRVGYWEVGGAFSTPLQGCVPDLGPSTRQRLPQKGGRTQLPSLSSWPVNQQNGGPVTSSTTDRAQAGWGGVSTMASTSHRDPYPPPHPCPRARSQHHGQKTACQVSCGQGLGELAPRGQHQASPGSVLNWTLGKLTQPLHPNLLKCRRDTGHTSVP